MFSDGSDVPLTDSFALRRILLPSQTACCVGRFRISLPYILGEQGKGDGGYYG